jgi:hypothetical protein
MESPSFYYIRRVIDKRRRCLQSLKAKSNRDFQLRDVYGAEIEVSFLQGWIAAHENIVEKITSANTPCMPLPQQVEAEL